MIAFHSIFPELAQREVRCLHVMPTPGVTPVPGLQVGEYAYVEFYCEDLDCDCRRVSFQVISREQQDKVMASINYGWEKEAFYQKRLPWDPEAPRAIVRASLDPINKQSEFAPLLLEWFQRYALDEPYRLRLRRHYRLFRDEIKRKRLTLQPLR